MTHDTLAVKGFLPLGPRGDRIPDEASPQENYDYEPVMDFAMASTSVF
jgi:hypothetical protein